MGGRDQSERLGAINRNQGSQSAGARNQARAPAELPSDLLCAADATMHRCLMVACVGQAVAPPAGKQLAGTIQHRGTAPAYRPPEWTEQTNQGRRPPRRQVVQVMGTRCSTDF